MFELSIFLLVGPICWPQVGGGQSLKTFRISCTSSTVGSLSKSILGSYLSQEVSALPNPRVSLTLCQVMVGATLCYPARGYRQYPHTGPLCRKGPQLQIGPVSRPGLLNLQMKVERALGHRTQCEILCGLSAPAGRVGGVDTARPSPGPQQSQGPCAQSWARSWSRWTFGSDTAHAEDSAGSSCGSP